jgi:hypothetical protein
MIGSSQFQRDEKKFSTLNACAQEEYVCGQFVQPTAK